METYAHLALLMLEPVNDDDWLDVAEEYGQDIALNNHFECCGECEGGCPLFANDDDLWIDLGARQDMDTSLAINDRVDEANERAEAFREDAQGFEDIATRLYAQALERELWFIRDGDNVFTAVKGVEPEDARLFLANIVSAYLAT